MDPIQSIDSGKDTGFAMLLAAQSRDYMLYYMEMGDLYLEDGEVYGSVRRLHVQEDKAHWFDLQATSEMLLRDLDVILMRKDPPFDMQYIYATYLLERAQSAGVLVVNKPRSLRDANEKLYTAWFKDHIPPTLVTRRADKIRAFYQKHQDIVLKPLDGMGGHSIFRLQPHDPNVQVVIETLTQHETAYTMVQAYLPEIVDGDKRIHIVHGEPIAYCLARIPAQGETRGNLAKGGKGVPMPVSDAEMQVAQAVAPALKEKGLLFVGLDMIGTKITEINVTAPTCVREIEAAYPVDIMGKFFDGIATLLRD